MRITLFALLVLLTSSVSALDYALIVGLHSEKFGDTLYEDSQNGNIIGSTTHTNPYYSKTTYHYDYRKLNEGFAKNQLIGIKLKSTNGLSLALTSFKNLYHEQSFEVALEYSYPLIKGLNMGINASALSGHRLTLIHGTRNASHSEKVVIPSLGTSLEYPINKNFSLTYSWDTLETATTNLEYKLPL